MVTVVVYQPLGHGDAVRVLAEAEVERGKLTVEGERTDLVDTSRKVFSRRREGFLVFDDDHEEWLRSFADTFNSAQVGAAITKDTRHGDLVAPKEFLERLSLQHAGAAR